MFKPILKTSATNKYYEKILNEISDLIASGELKFGDSLPSERDMAEKFETSRIPVREAIKILEFLGLVKHVPGQGMVIQQMEISDLISKIFFGIHVSDQTLGQLMDLRLLLEPYAAEQAAYHATPDDLAMIRQTIYETDELSAMNSSLDFHAAVIHASHNTLLEEIYTFLYSLLKQYRRESNLERRYNNGPIQYHSQIFEALRNKQGVSARCLMMAHLEDEKTFYKYSDSTTEEAPINSIDGEEVS